MIDVYVEIEQAPYRSQDSPDDSSTPKHNKSMINYVYYRQKMQYDEVTDVYGVENTKTNRRDAREKSAQVNDGTTEATK